MANTPSLPTEIWMACISFLRLITPDGRDVKDQNSFTPRRMNNRAALTSLSFTSSQLRLIAQPLLFERLRLVMSDIDVSYRLDGLMDLLDRRPEVSGWIRKLDVKGSMDGTVSDAQEALSSFFVRLHSLRIVEMTGVHLSTVIFAHLLRLSLSSLTLIGVSFDFDPTARYTDPPPQFLSIASITADETGAAVLNPLALSPHLKIITIWGGNNKPLYDLSATPRSHIFGALTSLTLRPNLYPPDNVHPGPLARFLSACPNLTTLYLTTSTSMKPPTDSHALKDMVPRLNTFIGPYYDAKWIVPGHPVTRIQLTLPPWFTKLGMAPLSQTTATLSDLTLGMILWSDEALLFMKELFPCLRVLSFNHNAVLSAEKRLAYALGIIEGFAQLRKLSFLDATTRSKIPWMDRQRSLLEKATASGSLVQTVCLQERVTWHLGEGRRWRASGL